MKKFFLLAGIMSLVGVGAAAFWTSDSSYAANQRINCSGSNCTSSGANRAEGQGQPDDLAGNNGIFKTITNILLFLIGTISVIMIVVGGIRYTISSGDSNQISGAKNTIMYAVVGLVVAILGYAIVEFVISSFD